MKTKNIYRNLLQYSILALLGYMVIRLILDSTYFADFEAYCPFGGLLALNSLLVNRTLACSMTEAQIFMGVALVGGVVVFSKLFCGYICPLGTLTEGLGKLGEKLRVRRTIDGVADRGLRSLKYGIMFLTFYFTVGASELFCRKYDPYYAVFSGFGHDVVLLYAVPALVLLVLGALFLRQSWCKYLCPLSAVSNVFTNAILVVAVIGGYLGLVYAGVGISWLWPLAVIAAGGFVLEAVRMRGWGLPPIRITRNHQTCTDCLQCDRACPMGIPVSASTEVTHMDCHLCGDCITACTESDVLRINRRRLRWLPPAATTLLIGAGLLLAAQVELPTINLRWGSEAEMSEAAVFSQSGLRSVKCYGSSMSFANQLKRVPGVLGVETFVKSHTVKVLYDPERVDEIGIQQAIFSPARTMISRPAPDVDSVAVAEMAIDGLLDTYDSFYLDQLLRQGSGVYGYWTRFGEPVTARIFYDPDRATPEDIRALIEVSEVTYESGGTEFTAPVAFRVTAEPEILPGIDRSSLVRELFQPVRQVFNGYEKYRPDQLSVYRIPMPEAADPSSGRQMAFLVSHLSTDDAVVGFETVFEDKPYAEISFLTGRVTADDVFAALTADSLTVHYSSGKVGRVPNAFQFAAPGTVFNRK